MPDLSDLIYRVEKASGPDRFWSKVKIGPQAECWPWQASKNKNGYGQFSVGSRASGDYRMLKAHRVAYELFCGPIPDGLSIDHLCRNRSCVNPHHLEPVTPAVNNQRAGAAKDRCWRGHKFTPENTIIGRNDTRECRACRLERKRNYRRAAAILRARQAMQMEART